MTSKSTTTATLQASAEVPIFLRKTFHMVDTCDPAVASWSEDGETFVVKDPIKFEKTIIPQFFKHSKFSSFVRQLNFYSFRKIKYADTIRIDPKLEAETANYWRFRHENFRRGRPDLLTEIKRTNGQKAAAAAPAAGASPAVDTEVQALKKRIEEMHKNIDQLTAMVEKVNLKQEEHEKEQEQDNSVLYMVGNKRKKVLVEDPIPDPEPVLSMPEMEPLSPVECNSSDGMVLDDLEPLPLAPAMPLPDAAPLSHRHDSNTTDAEFVDQLLTQFGEHDEVDFLDLDAPVIPDNRPDPELMQRLSDALMVLPKEIQEMIVERLIQSITSPDFEKNVVLAQEKPQPPVVASAVPVEMDTTADKQRQVAVPLAAATLAALLQHLCQQMPEGSNTKVPKTISKMVPVVPVHA